jgi:LemA protein
LTRLLSSRLLGCYLLALAWTLTLRLLARLQRLPRLPLHLLAKIPRPGLPGLARLSLHFLARLSLGLLPGLLSHLALLRLLFCGIGHRLSTKHHRDSQKSYGSCHRSPSFMDVIKSYSFVQHSRVTPKKPFLFGRRADLNTAGWNFCAKTVTMAKYLRSKGGAVMQSRWVLFLFPVLTALLSTSGCGYNQIQALDEETNAAWSEVLNQYQRRADLIPNLVNVVKGYAAHERETLEAVTQARAQATSIKPSSDLLKNPDAFKQYQQAQGDLSSALSRLLVVVDKYPDLKANENFRDLQSQLEGTENRIAVARKRYIDKVAEYNKSVRFFPTSLTAKYLLHLGVKPNFTVADEKAVTKPPDVKF